MVYPIYNLDFPREGKPKRDIAWYLRSLEDVIVETLGNYGVKAQGRSLQKKMDADQAGDETGVWVEDRKIASLGIGIRKWICFHGAAINLDADSSAFQGLKPCGFQPQTMVSLQELIKKPVDRDEFLNKIKNYFLKAMA